MNPQPGSSRITSAARYFRGVDAGIFPAELFSADFEFFYPKFGVARGVQAFTRMAEGVRQALVSSRHHQDRLDFMEAGNRVIVEGTTEGIDRDGVEWCGGKTPGGRFCSVFEFNDDGLITRMYIYLDPDLTSKDSTRFIRSGRHHDW